MKYALLINLIRAFLLCIIINFIYSIFISPFPKQIFIENIKEAPSFFLKKEFYYTVALFYIFYMPFTLFHQEIEHRFRRYNLLWHFLLCAVYVFFINALLEFWNIKGKEHPEKIYDHLYFLLSINELVVWLIKNKRFALKKSLQR